MPASPLPLKVAALLVPAVVFLGLHLPTLDYEFVWTDHGEIEQGTLIRPPERLAHAFLEPLHVNLDFRLAGSQQSYYRPLQVVLVSGITHALGKRPRHFRALSLALGTATVMLFAVFVRLLFAPPAVALFAASILAAHPASIEVYVWIAGLSAALAYFFVLVALIGTLYALRTSGTRRVAGIGVSVVGLLLGLLSKESAAATPLLTVALVVSVLAFGERIPAREGRRGFRITASALVAIQGLLVASYLLVWRPLVLGGMLTGAPPIGGDAATHVRSALALWPGVLSWLVVPFRSSTGAVVRIVDSWTDLGTCAGALLLLASVLTWLGLIRLRQGLAALGLAWVWIAYLPTSNIVPLLHARSERDLFFSVFGIALLWPALGSVLLSQLAPRARRLLPWALATLLVLFLGQRTAVRTPAWQSTLTLFETDLAAEPLHREARFEVALALSEAGMHREARDHLKTLFAQREEFATRTSYLREENAFELYCWVNLRLGRTEETIRFFAAELRDRATPTQMPGFSYCYAQSLEGLGRVAEALELYEELAALPSAGPDLFVAAARCHARLGHAEQAEAWLARVPREAAQEAGLARQVDRVRRLLERRRRGAIGRPDRGAVGASPR